MIDFPTAPLVGQTHTISGQGGGIILWTWDGIKWMAGELAGSSTGSAMMAVTETVTLPTGYGGFCGVANATGLPMTVFMPVDPVPRQVIEVKDTLGNAGLYPITVSGNYEQIEGAPSVTITSNYGWVSLTYTGTQWVQG